MTPSSWIGAAGDISLRVAWQDGERLFCRGWRISHDGKRSAVLVAVPTKSKVVAESSLGATISNPLTERWRSCLGTREVCVNQTYLSKLKKGCLASGWARLPVTQGLRQISRGEAAVGGHSSGSPALRSLRLTRQGVPVHTPPRTLPLPRQS
jgi:hypothetical protein